MPAGEAEIRFFCALCGSSLTAAAIHAGGTVKCVACGEMAPVPKAGRKEMASRHSWFGPEIVGVDVAFLCRGCDCKLIADAHLEGEAFACPRCGTEARVPSLSGRKRQSRPPVTLIPEEIAFLSSRVPAGTSPQLTTS